MSDKNTIITASFLLIFMAVISVLSMKDDSLTMDEMSHLPAGYSYVSQKDMRINPEHPPLIKDLAGIPLLFIKNIKFPSDIKAWKDDVNSQWDFGSYFLYKTGNPVDKMIILSRIPMILILIMLGIYLFIWTKELFGNSTALTALFFFSFSPTLIAHGRLVTTDVGAAAGAFISTYYFVKFLKDPTKKNIILGGIFFGIAELLKFSLILLIPFFAILVVVKSILKSSDIKIFLKNFYYYFIRCLLVGLIALVLIWIVYSYHVLNYPSQKQAKDTEFILSSFGTKTLTDLNVWMADKPILRPFAQYTLGLLMVLQRASGGNTGYFLGEISAAGWKTYFPFVYLIKEPLGFHILSLIALLFAIGVMFRKNKEGKITERMTNWLNTHFAEFSMLLFIIIYWTSSLTSNLNIGVRHLLPAFPFQILLVSAGITTLFLKGSLIRLKKTFIFAMMLWQVYAVISIYPHFISYFNEIIGGPKNGYLYVVDSNLDWGQDLKRLKIWLDENKIDKAYIDYFGGGNPQYYLKEKYAPWWGLRNPDEIPEGSYLAVSATLLQGGRGKPAPNFDQKTGYYLWLDKYQPMTVIGNSIFVFYIN
ncbi:MAG: glycosyltransferase family 39 protein [Candidatus Pacebacteria bacterium]|nr:glycosyltransferase family 39 protein [Candidatus Paceibacterota bacterium]